MKYFVVLSCLAVVAYGLAPEIAEKIKQQVMTYAGECKAEIGAADEDLAPLKAHQPATTQKGKCFLACMQKKFGFLDQSGKIDKDASHAVIEKMKSLDEELYGKMKKVGEICCAEVTDAADECETAANMFACVQREKEAAGIPSMQF